MYSIMIIPGRNITNYNQKRIITFLLLLPAFLLIAFRNVSVGSDTFAYYSNYINLGNYDSITTPLSKTWMEPGYIFLAYYFSHFGLDYYYFQFLITAVYFFSTYKLIIKYSYNIGTSCFLFVTLGCMFGMMNQTRMWLSIAIVMFSLQYIVDRKLLNFIIIIILASTIHVSSLVFLFAYPICILIEKDLYKYSFMIICLSGLVLLAGSPFLMKVTELTNHYSIYTSSESTGFRLAAVLNLMINLGIFIMVFQSEKHNIRNDFADSAVKPSFNSTTINLMFSLMTFGISIVELSNSYISRLLYFYSFPLVFVLANVIENNKDWRLRYFSKLAIIACFTLKTFIVLKYRPQWDSVLPYSFYWE